MTETEQLISKCMEAMYTFKPCIMHNCCCFADGPLGCFHLDYYDRYELNDELARTIVGQAALSNHD